MNPIYVMIRRIIKIIAGVFILIGLVVTTFVIVLIFKNQHPSLDDRLYLAAASRDTNEAAHLIEAGANVNMIATKLTKSSPLDNALFFQDSNMVALLLSKGADPSHHDGTGRSVLYFALEAENSGEIVRMLIEHGADTLDKEVQTLVKRLPPDSENRLTFERYAHAKPGTNTPSSQ